MSEVAQKETPKRTDALVHEAADNLFRQGRGHEITTRKILEIIGQGSLTTIQKALDTWWEDTGSHVTQLEGFFKLPEQVAKPLMDAIKAVQAESAQHALKAYDAQIEAAQAEVANLTLEKDEAISGKRQADSDIEALKETIAGLSNQARTLERDLERAEGRCESLESQVENIRADAKAMVQNAEAKVREMEQKLVEAREQVKLADQRHDETENRLVALLEEQKSFRRTLERDSAEEIKKLQKVLDTSNNNVHTLQVEASRNQATIEAQGEAVRALERDNRSMDKELRHKLGECSKLQANIENLQAEIEGLAEDRQELVSELKTLKDQYNEAVIEKEVFRRQLDKSSNGRRGKS
ncbi:hypothetical protein Tel_16785 (plasmid) [Candidatus Tenderia electrophaga]|jgi:chromosome segregation ATPase|uniref:KfrA N-terminal DNA-binding domain-containing protein n=1 Tax=Candidatus Tenderia electrophaga TaxID=1748243 RepID=A0A0S2TIA9_9GAMM|nr:hypothetical protein Tel_16785 [Candidatus Tenderia electrophaga]